MTKVLIYTTPTCPYCFHAKALLEKKQIAYEEICVLTEPEKRKEMQERTGRTSVPQIFINEKGIGGCDALYALEDTGELDNLLSENEYGR